MIKIYGIKNCDTMKKALKWLDDAGVSYDFIDYKKAGVAADLITAAISQHGWEAVINKRGTTWRKLDDDLKNNMNAESALSLAIEQPSVIKRPLLLRDGDITLGFSADAYAALLG